MGELAKLRKATVSFVMSVCPYVRMEQLDSHWTDFREILYFLFRKSVEDVQISSKVSEVLPRQAEVAQGVLGSLRPRIFLTFRHYKGGRSSAKGTGRLYPRRNPWYSLPEADSTSGHMVLSGVPRKKFPVTPPESIPGPPE